MKTSKKILSAILGFVFVFLATPIQFVYQFIAQYLDDAEINISPIQIAYAESLSSIDEALSTFMPGAEFSTEMKSLTPEMEAKIPKKAKIKFDPAIDSVFNFYVGRENGEIVGYAIPYAVPGKWGSIQFMLYLSPKGKVKDVLVLSYEEQRGKPVAKKRFLKQFRGKSHKSKIRLMADIRGVNGATISSSGMTNGIRKLVHVFNVIYGEDK